MVQKVHVHIIPGIRTRDKPFCFLLVFVRRVTGIITKKDVIKHVAAMQGNKKPDVVRYGTL